MKVQDFLMRGQRKYKAEAMGKELVKPFESYLKLLTVFIGNDIDSTVDKNLIKEYLKDSKPFIEEYLNTKRQIKLLEDIKEGRNGTGWSNSLGYLADELKDTALPELQTDNDISNDQLNYLKDVILYFKKGSEPALNRIEKSVGRILKDPKLNKIFLYDVGTQATPMKKLNSIVKKLTGKDDYKIDAQTAKKVKQENEELYKEYLKTRREVLEISKKAIANIVRSSGKPYVDVDKMRKALKSKGILIHNIPDGFEGNIGDDGSLYTTTGLKLQGIPLGSVHMNPQYDPNKDNSYVFWSDGDGTFKTQQRYYTLDYKKRGRAEKFEKVAKIADKLDSIRKKWLQPIINWKGDKKSVASLMLEIAYKYGARIGSASGMTDGKPTYGLSTWLGKHVKVEPNRIIIKYPGKKGMIQKHIIKNTGDKYDKLLFNHLKELVDEKGSKDYIFTDERGRHVSAGDVNSLLKQYGSKVSVHKLRHLKANNMFDKELEKFAKKNPSQKDLEQFVKETALKVGKELGHQSTKSDGSIAVSPMTSLNNYVNPDRLKQFFKQYNQRYPKWLEKLKTVED
jgi:hypothetical protein